MARQKRGSRVLEKAQVRLDGLQAIDPKLGSGGFTVSGYQKKIQALRTEISQYNTALANVDELTNRVQQSEKELAEYSSRMLLAVASVYGLNSSEYEKAGGKRKSERKRGSRRPAMA